MYVRVPTVNPVFLNHLVDRSSQSLLSSSTTGSHLQYSTVLKYELRDSQNGVTQTKQNIRLTMPQNDWTKKGEDVEHVVNDKRLEKKNRVLIVIYDSYCS